MSQDLSYKVFWPTTPTLPIGRYSGSSVRRREFEIFMGKSLRVFGNGTRVRRYPNECRFQTEKTSMVFKPFALKIFFIVSALKRYMCSISTTGDFSPKILTGTLSRLLLMAKTTPLGFKIFRQSARTAAGSTKCSSVWKIQTISKKFSGNMEELNIPSLIFFFTRGAAFAIASIDGSAPQTSLNP